MFILGIPLLGSAQEVIVVPDTTKAEQFIVRDKAAINARLINAQDTTVKENSVAASDTTGQSSIGDTSAVTIALKDSTDNAQDTVVRKGGLEDILDIVAADSMIISMDNKKVYLHKQAKIVYQDLQVEAGYIVINYETQELFACGIPDSTGTKIVETPVFKEGADEYAMETLNYNFETRKAKISTVITHQGEGFLHGKEIKMMPDKSVNVGGGMYTTCDHPHPHFYLSMTKSKMIPEPNSKIVFGFSYLVIEDVPMPAFLPFGFVPRMSDRSSGLIFPTFGEEVSRGFFLQGLGYYFVLGEYFDIATTIDYYTLGSWGSHNVIRYKKRYRFDGSLNFDITNNVVGDKGSTDYYKSGDFRFTWSHTQAQQANPTTQFSASVNLSSPTYSSLNGESLNQHLSPSTSSTVRFSKSWEDKPINLSINLTHRQQMRNLDSDTRKKEGEYTLGIPSLTFDVGKFAPFKRKNAVGKEKFYEGFRFSYGMRFENSITFTDKQWGESDFFDRLDNGMSHAFGIDLPSFSLFKYINVSPSVNYGMNWHFRSTKYAWNNTTNALDTIKSGAFSELGITQNYGFGLSMNTTLYGLIQFKSHPEKGDPLIKAVRHVFKPSISFGYTPDLRNHGNGWRSVKSTEDGKVMEYNIYSGQKFSSLGGSESASMNINISNSLEFKLRNRKDTTGTNSLKLKLLESFNISTSYNFLADSMKLAIINFSGRTNIFDKFGMSFGFRVDPYDIDEKGNGINKLYWARHGGLKFGRMTSFNTSFDYTISGGKGKGVEAGQNPNPVEGVDYFSPHNTLYYVDFSVPWSLSAGVNYSMTKSYPYNSATGVMTPVTNNIITLNVRGSVTPTQNWMVSFSSGYDFNTSEIANTQVSIHRDLHCFEFNFSWIPVGRYKSWSFGINVKGSSLRDLLKYDKRSSRFDNYFNAL
ncbi:MAG: hypothetical protein LBG19_11990 [Prevotellaceae bacterium]|jgi:hypothetical protein|nr:hypothetical protein [Prevotellaceae bacterium]